MPSENLSDYQTDILEEGFEQKTLNFENDYDGEVIATLVRKKSENTTQKAVLYIHGFIDYFFQKEMAERFNQQGFNFYALDLRKYGRSLLAHQKPYFVKDLTEYDAEIQAALNIIEEEGHNSVLLAGHSTGGLTATYFLARYPNNTLIKALWANSPFYDFNMSILKKKYGLPLITKLAQKFPNIQFPSELNPFYVTSIHENFNGEWNFDLKLKPQHYPLVYISFIGAVVKAQTLIQSGPKISVPTLVMHSDKTTNPKKFNIEAQISDVILDVKTIEKYGKSLQGDVNVMTIHDGLHDLVLSKRLVREKVYLKLFEWLESKGL